MTGDGDDALRVGIILDRLDAPRWVHHAVRAIRESPDARLALVVLRGGDGERETRTPGHPGFWRRCAYELFVRLDARLFRGRPDLLEASDLAPLLSGCPSVQADAAGRAERAWPGEAEREAIRGHRLDVVVDLGDPPPGHRTVPLARLGTWSYRHGSTPYLAARPAGFREIADDNEGLFSALITDGGDGRPPRVLYGSWSAVDRRSVHRTLNACLAKLAQFPARALREARRGLREDDRPEDATPAPLPSGDARPLPPGNAEVGAVAATLATRYALDKLRGIGRRETWHLACALGQDSLSPRPERILPQPSDCFRADPFAVADETGYWVFFEEAPLKTEVGHIGVMRMDRAGRCGQTVRVLERGWHLSYPCVFRAGEEWYLVPESSATRSVTLFRARRFPFEWEEQVVLLEGVRAFDPTLREIGGRWWMFVNQAPEEGSSWDELHLYHADRPQGPWHAHPRNPVVSDARKARPAGHLFERRGSLYRPGQDCAVGYGRSVVVNRVLRIDRDAYAEVEAARIGPDRDRHVAGVHTLNRAGDLTMMDCMLGVPRWR